MYLLRATNMHIPIDEDINSFIAHLWSIIPMTASASIPISPPWGHRRIHHSQSMYQTPNLTYFRTRSCKTANQSRWTTSSVAYAKRVRMIAIAILRLICIIYQYPFPTGGMSKCHSQVNPPTFAYPANEFTARRTRAGSVAPVIMGIGI